MQNNTRISAEEMDRIARAMEKLSSRELPKVRIGEPSHDGYDDQREASVDWFSVGRFASEVEGCSLAPDIERKLFEQGLHVQAAKRQLVVVEKVLPKHGITFEEAQLIASVRRPRVARANKSHRWDLGPQAHWPHPEEWVHEDTVLLLERPSDDNFPLDTMHFYRFLASDKLEIGHVPYVEEYLFQAEVGPFEEYAIPATEETKFAADVLWDIAHL